MQYHIIVAPKVMVTTEVEVSEMWLITRVSRNLLVEKENDDLLKSRIYFTIETNDEKHVSALAGRIAQYNPGHDVYVLQGMKVFSTSLPPIVEKAVTDKGVLPV